MGDLPVASSQLASVDPRLDVVLIDVAGGVANENEVAAEGEAEAGGAGRVKGGICLETGNIKIVRAIFLTNQWFLLKITVRAGVGDRPFSGGRRTRWW